MKLETLRNLNKDDILGALGLGTRRSTSDKWVNGMAWLGAGLVVGAVVALAFAPKSGSELRSDMSWRLRSARDRASETVDRVRDQVDRKLHGSV
ncbi:MAG: YtxH domain-containing protein [Deltaproteobacteria bacterium]|nr:YtxH domain-containing protein [Deltaproteobacteria bacterium]